MSELLIKNPKGFGSGYTPITQIGETKNNTDINFGILKLKAGKDYDLKSDFESAYLLMNGKAMFSYDQMQYEAERHSLFDEDPIAIHIAAKRSGTIKTHTDCEFAVSQVNNDQSFETLVFDKKNMLESEQRGKDLLNDTAHRIVRTIFDIRNRPNAKLVLGEVINFPGKWSSYPPHHHPQPELYHYRFTEPNGFSFGQSGDENNHPNVVIIHQYDTLKILYDLVHSHVAAPGYGMYYIWVIRHLDGNPYTVPEFDKEHAWTMSKEANKKVWKANG